MEELDGHFLWGSAADFGNDRIGFLNQFIEMDSPIIKFRMVHKKFYLVQTPELIKDVLLTKKAHFRKSFFGRKLAKPLLGSSLFLKEGQDWQERRKLLAPLFQPRTLSSYIDGINEIIDAQLRGWPEKGRVNFTEEMLEMTLKIVSQVVVGFDEDQELRAFGKHFEDAQNFFFEKLGSPVRLPLSVPTAAHRKFFKTMDSLDEMLYEAIKSREASGSKNQKNMLDILLNQRAKGEIRLTDKEIRDELITFLFAGHETTALGLGWIFTLLATHPDVMAKIHQEMSPSRPSNVEALQNIPYLTSAIKEGWRHYPPAYAFTREIKEEVEIAGELLPKGGVVLISPYILHRNSEYYERPFDFYPEHFEYQTDKSRDRYAWLPFGAGPRICIGSAFALLESQLILDQILRQYTLEGLEKLVAPAPSITLRPSEDIFINVVRR